MRECTMMASPMMIAMCLTVGLAVGLVLVAAFWRICAKAGFPGWYGVAAVIPMVSVLLVLFVAFAEWPLERERRPRTRP